MEDATIWVAIGLAVLAVIGVIVFLNASN